MKLPLSVFLGLVLAHLVLAPSVVAQAPKIGYVDIVKLVEQAPQGEKARKKLEQEFGPRDKEVIKNRKNIRVLEKELENLASSAGDTIRRKKERELIGLRRNLKRTSQEFREDYNLRRNEELGALQKIVYKAIVDIAKSEGFDLVLHEGAVYASDRIDITDKVLQKLRGK